MSSPPRPRLRQGALLLPHVSQAAGLVISQECRQWAEKRARGMPPWLRRELLDAFDSMAAAGRQWVEWTHTGEPVDEVVGDRVDRELTVQEAAKILRVGDRMVTKLIARDELRARMVRGRWLVVEVDVLERRRRLAAAS